MTRILQLKISFILIIMLFGCSQEDPSPVTINRSFTSITYKDVPDLVSSINLNLGLKNNKEYYQANTDPNILEFRINWFEGTKFVDLEGNISYAFGVYDNDGDIGVFRNIVVKEYFDNSYSLPFLYTYTMSKEFLEVYKKSHSLENFEGTVEKVQLGVGQYSNRQYGANLESQRMSSSDPCPNT